MGIFWQLLTSILRIQRKKSVIYLILESTSSLPRCFVCEANAQHWWARAFQNSQEVPLLSFLGTLRADNIHHSPFTYRQAQPPFTFTIPRTSNHFSPENLTQLISQAHNDFPTLADPRNTLSSINSSNLKEIQVYRICTVNHSLQVKNNLRVFFSLIREHSRRINLQWS